jgi:IclR family acetate operon transcriptional repressor
MSSMTDLPEESPPSTRTGAQSIGRAIAVLQCFEGAAELGVTEIARETELSLATAHRIVRALHTGGLLDQNTQTDRYHLGFGTAVLGRLAMERLGFAFALPELERLAVRTGEAVNLGVRVGTEVLVLLAVPSVHPLRFEQAAGTRNPLHVGAMGKVLLAFGGSDAIGSLRLERFTPNTITTESALTSELETIRARGHAINDEERNLGVRAIAAPVCDASRQAVAAIAVQGPTVRITDERLADLIHDVTAAAVELTEVYRRSRV